MSTRKVTLKLTSQTKPVEYQTSARTFGELKAELKDVKFDGMRVVERASKNTLQMDDAVLPAGDFLLFLVPEKVKSGYRLPKIDIDNASYNELRSHASMLNKVKNAEISLAGKVDDLRSGLRQYYKGQETPKELQAQVVKTPEGKEVNLIEQIQFLRTEINQTLDHVEEIINIGSMTNDEEIVCLTTIKDLEEEFAAVKRSLNL